MTTHISKDDLALMMPGTLYHYFKDGSEYRVPTPPVRPSLFVRLATALADWMQRRAER